MKIVGIDFGWLTGESGIACMEVIGTSLCLRMLGICPTANELLERIAMFSGDGPALVAIDAPLIISNRLGQRDAERRLNELFQRYDAGCYPSNLGRPFAVNTTKFSKELSELGFIHGCDIEPMKAGRYQIEVYPHAATVRFFELQRILKYKKGTVSQKNAELSRLTALIQEQLSNAIPALLACEIPTLPARGRELKRVEDKVDAILCAYMGAHWWYWGAKRNECIGNAQTGYIIVPREKALTRQSAGRRVR